MSFLSRHFSQYFSHIQEAGNFSPGFLPGAYDASYAPKELPLHMYCSAEPFETVGEW